MNKKIIAFFMIFIASCEMAHAVNFDKMPKLPFEVAVSGPLLPDGQTGVLSPAVAIVGTTEHTVWSEAENYVFMTSPTLLSLASTSANDSAAGTGLRTLSVICLDENYDSFTEIVTLNGLTPVPMSKACLRVQGNGMTGLTVGSTGSNVGKIYIGHGAFTLGVPANKQGVMLETRNRSNFGVFTVPRRFALFVTQLTFSNFDNALTEFTIRVKPENLASYQAVSFSVKDFSQSISSFAPQRIPEKTSIEIRAKADVSNVKVKFLLSYFMAPNI